MAFQPTVTCPLPGIYLDPETGEALTFEGYGAMQESSAWLLDLDVDLLAPIYDQVCDPGDEFACEPLNGINRAA